MRIILKNLYTQKVLEVKFRATKPCSTPSGPEGSSGR